MFNATFANISLYCGSQS